MKFTFAPESRPLEGYTIKRAIYRGGFGEVYYALSDAGREVALKLLQHNTDVELRGVQQCLNLSHPNLVTIFDVRQDGDGDHWIIMEYIAGETLDTTLRRQSSGMPVETVRSWLRGLTDGMTYLHSRGLVHRDLKPANMFMENGVVKIGDVGLSKFIAPSRHSAQTQSVGTVHYMAPEVAKGRYGREVDIYAIGIILYEMLTGKLPFDGESTGEILMKHLSEPPDLSPLPPRIRPVIEKALQKDPKERFSRVEALQRAFEEAVLGVSSPKSTEEVPDAPGHARVPDRLRSPTAGYAQLREGQTHRKKGSKGCGTACGPTPAWVKGVAFGGLGLLGMGTVFGWDLSFPMVVSILFFSGLIAYSNSKKAEKKSKLNQVRQAAAVKVSTPQPQPPRVRQSWGTTGDLLGSMFLTVPISVMLITCLAALKPSLLGGARSLSEVDPANIGLFALASILSSWVLISIPFSILRAPENRFRRISRYHYGLAGLFVGVVVYLIEQFLMVADLGTPSRAIFSRLGDQSLFIDGVPSWIGFMAFFAVLFSFANWQQLSSPRRKDRFSIAAVIGVVFVAWLTTTVFAFPTQFGMALAVIIACVTQLSSPFDDWRSKQKSRNIA
ncbi:serine/threonine-protein kinase [Thalassoglobus sp. JC818]|uniref:serine/threonine protein kinase n=1 Tax=Thalassoglobus sp. JC818 TaxID=3232136 RepID=UPI00345A5D1D